MEKRIICRSYSESGIADQADALGYFEFDLQGGELLLRPDILFETLEAIKPERFYLYLTTNGYQLDKSMAKKLAEHHVSRVSVSKDSMNEKNMMKLEVEKIRRRNNESLLSIFKMQGWIHT